MRSCFALVRANWDGCLGPGAPWPQEAAMLGSCFRFAMSRSRMIATSLLWISVLWMRRSCTPQSHLPQFCQRHQRLKISVACAGNDRNCFLHDLRKAAQMHHPIIFANGTVMAPTHNKSTPHLGSHSNHATHVWGPDCIRFRVFRV